MSSTQKNNENFKEIISTRSQANKLIQQNDATSNNDLIKVAQKDNQINDEEIPTFVDRYEERTKEICEIWGIILPTMWW